MNQEASDYIQPAKEAGLVNHGRRSLCREAVGRLGIAAGKPRWTFSTHRLEKAFPVPGIRLRHWVFDLAVPSFLSFIHLGCPLLPTVPGIKHEPSGLAASTLPAGPSHWHPVFFCF